MSDARVPPSPGHLTFNRPKLLNQFIIVILTLYGGTMQKKFRGLSIIGLLLKIIGVLEMIVGLVSALIIPLVLSDSHVSLLQFGLQDVFPASGLVLGIITGVFVFLVGLVCGLLTFSAGELFNVVIAIEENTRITAMHLQKKD